MRRRVRVQPPMRTLNVPRGLLQGETRQNEYLERSHGNAVLDFHAQANEYRPPRRFSAGS